MQAAREARIPISAGRLYNLNDIIQLHKCTKIIKKGKKEEEKTANMQADNSAHV